MKAFLDENFLLHTETAKLLYHQYAKQMPVIDYHCHLPPKEIAEDVCFNNLTQAWLYGDHYKWRAMRANGINENFITGNTNDWQKFEKWAGTVPYTLRNPLFHWTHLELQRYFNISTLLNHQSAKYIYHECSALLQTPEYSVRNLLLKMNVRVVCTTDDPADDLRYHQQIRQSGFEVKVLPAFRPDKAMDVSNVAVFNQYISRVEAAANVNIHNFDSYLIALKKRHNFFNEMGCQLSDHGLEKIDAEPFTEQEVEANFNKIRAGNNLSIQEQAKIRSCMLLHFAKWDFEKDWVQQFHLGAIRNNNKRLMQSLGADSGCDSIGDCSHALSLSRFLNRLDTDNKLTKTILYNLNPSDNEVFATMAGNFNNGDAAGKIQWGSAWWFLDQKDGIEKQLNTLSNMGLLSRFVGMLTDSRSFLSYPRHEYFRRILCNILGEEIEKGELPDNVEWTGKMVQDICYNNAVDYFRF